MGRVAGVYPQASPQRQAAQVAVEAGLLQRETIFAAIEIADCQEVVQGNAVAAQERPGQTQILNGRIDANGRAHGRVAAGPAALDVRIEPPGQFGFGQSRPGRQGSQQPGEFLERQRTRLYGQTVRCLGRIGHGQFNVELA